MIHGPWTHIVDIKPILWTLNISIYRNHEPILWTLNQYRENWKFTYIVTMNQYCEHQGRAHNHAFVSTPVAVRVAKVEYARWGRWWLWSWLNEIYHHHDNDQRNVVDNIYENDDNDEDKQQDDDEVKYLFDIKTIAEEVVPLSQRESGSFVFSKLHRFLFIITKDFIQKMLGPFQIATTVYVS